MSNLEKRIQVGACSASIFAREVDTVSGRAVMRNVVLQRTYKDKDDKYQHTNNYGMNDLPKAILALQKAYEYLAMQGPSENQERYQTEDKA
jgi:hypothetical protein